MNLHFFFVMTQDNRYKFTVLIAFVHPVVIIPHIPVCQFTENSIQLVSNGGNFATVIDDPTDPARCFRIAITDDTDSALTKKFTTSFVVDFAEPDWSTSLQFLVKPLSVLKAVVSTV